MFRKMNIGNQIQKGAIYMSNYSVVLQEAVNGVSCDFYGDGLGEFFMTRRQIGEALEYENPQIAISKIHNAHKERLDRFSTVSVLDKVEGGREVQREMVLYSAKGVYEICRWSRQPAADAFFDRVYDILEGLRTGKLRASLLPKQDQATIAMRENIERTVVEWFETIEAALQSERYYLVPRSSQEQYRKPLEQTLGIYDNNYYYIHGRIASELYREVRPTFQRNSFYAVLMAAGILVPRPEGMYCDRERRTNVLATIYGKQYPVLRLARKNCPLQFTVIGENQFDFVDPLMEETVELLDECVEWD
jgi:prophage antirepressor-like protein